MKKWKISRLKIQAFKAFPSIEFDFQSCSLLTLEGPNGYGKTTVFDAIELLLTGKISRITEIYNAVMPAALKKYKDNLYWNKRNGEKNIEIRGQISNDEGDNLYFIRVAQIADLKIPTNNKADMFGIFKLYALESFDSNTFNEQLPPDHLDTYFGEGFSKNYSMLNYLQQGQSTFVFAKRITDRKSALEELLKTRETRNQIDLLSKIELRLAKASSSVEQQNLTVLEQKIATLSNLDSAPQALTQYKRITTRIPQPYWDLEEPFTNLDEAQYRLFMSELDLLIDLLSQKTEIKTLKKNISIERYIAEKSQLFDVAVCIGKHLNLYGTLDLQYQRILILTKAIALFEKSPSQISSSDIEVIKATGTSVDSGLLSVIIERDKLLRLLDGKSAKIMELNKLRDDLLAKHKEVFGLHDSHCALCGIDWETSEKLQQTIAVTTSVYESEIGVLSGQLQEHYRVISYSLDPIKTSLTSELTELEKVFNHSLYNELGKNLNNFEELKRLNDHLAVRGVDYSAVFTTDITELSGRKQLLITNIRALKDVEGNAPPIGWEQAISNNFAKIEDFYSASPTDFADKRGYITIKHRLQQNSTLQANKLELAQRQLAFKAATAAKEKVSKLKNLLTTTERNYSASVISNIELIFHIYSGRLIQNYQRGLGLFIDCSDGKQLQFCTAEHSAHDATLSMSSGQISALSLSFFLSLNRVYSEGSLVLIDDPAQSLDEINIASLTDLLRCELSDRQLILSSHEDNIAGYMRYRFKRAGLSQKPFHMQSHAEDSTK